MTGHILETSFSTRPSDILSHFGNKIKKDVKRGEIKMKCGEKSENT